MSNKQLFLVSCILLASISYAFVPSSAAWLTNCRPRAVVNSNMDKASLSPLVVVSMAGFASADGDSNKKKKEMKLKPKQQWDRFASLKKETSVLVAVRVVGQEDWLEVGRVKSKDNASIEAAVAKQRVIIAEHSRRLFPLQVSKDAKVTCDGKASKLSDLKSGTAIRVTTSKDDPKKIVSIESGKPVASESRPPPSAARPDDLPDTAPPHRHRRAG